MTRNKPVHVSLVIPTKDKMTHLRIVLEAFSPQISDDVEVIVIFDGCRDATLNEFKKLSLSFAPEAIVCERGVGRAAARNLGIQHARGEIIILSDDDVIPCSDFIQKHRARHHERCVLLGEVRYLQYSEQQIAQLGALRAANLDFEQLERDTIKKTLTALRRLYRPLWDRALKPISFLTTNVSVAKSDLLRVGLFDERFQGWGYEDIDLGYRLGAAGIPFRRDSSAVNYHINHPVDRKAKSDEARANLRYFLHKIKDDQLARLALLSYLKLATIFGKFQ